MRRFWKQAVTVERDGAWIIELDGKPVRTPARALLELPTEALANAVAEEWNAVGESLEPRSLPLTGLANAAIDRIAPDREAFVANLANYAQGDLGQPLRQRDSGGGGLLGMLEQERALHIARAVESAAQAEVALEQRAARA